MSQRISIGSCVIARWARFLFFSLGLLLFADKLLAQQPIKISAAEVARQLDLLKGTIATDATEMLRTNAVTGSYTTVWRQFEDLAMAALEAILPRHIPELTAKNFDGGQARAGREKNRLADFAISCGTNVIEISIKAARAGANPENDMGTFRDHPHRKQLFTASFTLWVRYTDAGGRFRCDRVFFDRTWRFVGKASLVNGVKYRKKDGNMRPKPWAMFDAGESFWKDEAEFEAAVKRAERYRANELIREHLENLSDNDQRVLYEQLRGKFEVQKN
jgi:hypothetical protein